MAEKLTLKRALRAMATGSKSGFHSFYNGTAAFIYSSARLLYPTHEDACRFMVDVYQYLYLHLPEYSESQSIEKWISRMIYERYTQLSIGRDPLMPSVSSQMEAGTAVLDEAERKRIWRMLDVRIHFPPEERKRPSVLQIVLLVSALALLALVLNRYIPAMLSQTGSPEHTAEAGTDTPNADIVTGSAVQTDDSTEFPSITADNADDSVSDDADDTSIDALENLELNLRYGDSLLYGDENKYSD